jgi:hypothetical protein
MTKTVMRVFFMHTKNQLYISTFSEKNLKKLKPYIWPKNFIKKLWKFLDKTFAIKP